MEKTIAWTKVKIRIWGREQKKEGKIRRDGYEKEVSGFVFLEMEINGIL